MKNFWIGVIIIFVVIMSIGVFNWIMDSPEEEKLNLNLSINSNLSTIRSVVWDFNYGGKEWANFTILNADCKEVRCSCADEGCLAYCLECSENIKSTNKLEEQDA